ncbi:glycosyltransferase family protein (plasmid) [Azospirillum oryzae]|uniref:Glycosyltransferase family protein n=1 Tax=Azospirillum oryzae TaxID=286727 RepID=A0A6N1ABS5_9PROT|nr:tetratricopeptide repeat protein [Azospirillum oryzae]KAA0584384.1 tetratricopeptide repeat protein [Azospirillum oryzae]QKS48986.1 glycosyltransferase family protein [Azospirillum oryzae]
MNIQQAFATALGFQQSGQTGEAARLYGEIVAADPLFAPAVNNLGLLRANAGHDMEAVALFRRALSLSPDSLNGWNNLGALLVRLGRPEEAVRAYRAAIRLKPDQPAALNEMGIQLERLKRPEEACDAFARAAALAPGDAEIANNHGAMLRMAHRLDEAAARFRRAIALNPHYAGAYSNLGSTVKDKGAFWEALLAFRRATRLDPDFAGAHWNESLVRLLLGDFVQGWRGYEWRWKHGRLPSPQRSFVQPRWDGSPLQGRRLLVYWEQGFGDVLQFVRYLPLLARTAGGGTGGQPVYLECQRALLPVLRRLPGTIAVETGGPLPDFDVQIPVLSLPALFGTRLETVPSRVPYLTAEPDLAARWGERLKEVAKDGGGLKVGIVWAGAPTHGNDRNRSIGLAPFARLAAIPGVSLVSIQKGPTEGQAANPPGGFPLLNLSPDIKDFADTAAIMAGLDLVVCVDTSVAHLAGALGVPVWVLVPFAPDWRWMLDRDDSPWYPTMRLFRQDRPGSWDDAMDRLEHALRSRAAAKDQSAA